MGHTGMNGIIVAPNRTMVSKFCQICSQFALNSPPANSVVIEASAVLTIFIYKYLIVFNKRSDDAKRGNGLAICRLIAESYVWLSCLEREPVKGSIIGLICRGLRRWRNMIFALFRFLQYEWWYSPSAVSNNFIV